MNALAIARDLAARYPAARLPCPACTARLDPANLERHVTKVHAGVVAAPERWPGKGLFGIAPCSLSIEADGAAVVLHHWLGLAHRRVAVPCEVEIGRLYGTRVEAGSSHAADYNVPEVTVRTGTYLRLIAGASITIGCKQAGELRGRWEQAGWRAGKRRGRCDITVGREALIAIEYALAGRGLLVPSARD
jgi:hypothetical protein